MKKTLLRIPRTLPLAFALALGGFLWNPFPPSARADSPPTALTPKSLDGVWVGRKDFGPYVRGTLTLERRAKAWQGEVAGMRFPVNEARGVLSFELPGEQGRFRGRRDPESGKIYGQWIQPPAVSGFGQRFSTPVHLAPLAENRWQGEILPFGDSIHISLSIATGSGEDREPRIFLRNPESNFGRILSLTDLNREGDQVEFLGTLAWQKEEAPRSLLTGTFHGNGEVLSIFLEEIGGTHDLKLLSEGEPSHFRPRGVAPLAYRYTPPVPGDDGWPVASLQEAGMKAPPVEGLVRKILAQPMDGIEAPHINALLLARGGRLVLEEYFHGFHRHRAHDVRSASKSLTTTLAGAALEAGELSLEAPVYRTMSEGSPPAQLEPRKESMTLEHLLTMSSGLACDDWDRESPGGEDRIQNQAEIEDWHRYLLDLPMLHDPGSHGAYCSVGMSLAGEVMARTLGAPLTEIFDRLLGRPLGLGPYHTNLMPNGKAYAGGGLRLRARDLLKFGQLMLDDGSWQGRRILPEGWLAKATKRRHTLGTRRPEGYGYGWWLFEYPFRDGTVDAFYAGGNGGNYIIVVPDLDLVVAILGSNYSQNVQHEIKYEDVPKYILPAVMSAPVEAGDP